MTARVFVLGSYIADMIMRTPHLPPRGETVIGGPFRIGPGGKGSNQAVAARRAGAEVLLATRVGDDPLGRDALALFDAEGIDSRAVVTDTQGIATGAALIMVEEASAENMIAVALGACAHFTAAEVDAAVAAARGCAVALFQHETNPEATLRALAATRAAGTRTILNPAPARALPPESFAAIDMLIPNETEATALTGIATDDADGIRAAAATLRARGCGTVIVTLGARGTYVDSPGLQALVPAAPGIVPVDTTGAGDCFAGCLAAALGEGRDLHEALRFANTGAGLSTTRHGAAPAMPQRAEIDAWLAR